MNLSTIARRNSIRMLVTACTLATAPAFAAAPAWQADVYYTAGTVVAYNGGDYSALVNQTDYSATGWNPTTASLWTFIGPDSSSGSGSGSSGSGSGSSSGSSGTGSTGTTTTTGTCAAAWSATAVYTGGAVASVGTVNYVANWWTQGNNPATSNGPAGSGQPWTSQGACSSSGTGSGGTGSGGTGTGGTGSGGGTSTPPGSFVFSPYKDITISMNWNTNVISTVVTGSAQAVLTVMPSNLQTLTWAFATGECGSENWGGLSRTAVAAANVQNFVSSGKYYILSTGGAGGTFTCGSDSGFDSFIQTYNSANLLGVDFDIEGGQSVDVINNLIARVKVAQGKYPKLRFSFTIATLGGNSPQSLGPMGVTVMNAIKSAGLTNYLVDLMAMDYGSTLASNCTISNGVCEMGQSAIAASENFHSFYGVPYSQIELTPMIGGNDTQGETFTLADVSAVSTYAKQKGLAGVHFWSFDRDNDCAPGSSSPTCNSYGQAGRLGFTTQFLSNLGL